MGPHQLHYSHQKLGHHAKHTLDMPLVLGAWLWTSDAAQKFILRKKLSFAKTFDFLWTGILRKTFFLHLYYFRPSHYFLFHFLPFVLALFSFTIPLTTYCPSYLLKPIIMKYLHFLATSILFWIVINGWSYLFDFVCMLTIGTNFRLHIAWEMNNNLRIAALYLKKNADRRTQEALEAAFQVSINATSLNKLYH